MKHLPKKHKAILFKDFRKPLVVEDIPTPSPQHEEVLMKIVSVGLCHSDVLMWKGMLPVPKLPTVLGHEIVGTVVAKGENVPNSIKKGKTFLVYIGGQYVAEDEYVRRGLEHHSKTWKPFMGGFQEYLIVPHYRFLVDLEGLEDILAASPLGCAGLTAYGAIKKIRPFIMPDDYVVIVGLGGLGLYAAQFVNLFFPHTNLIGVDVREDALEFASKTAKIDLLVNASKEDPLKIVKDTVRERKVNAILDFVGSAKTLATYIPLLSSLGVYIIAGMMDSELKLPRLPLEEITIRGTKTGSLQDQYDVINFARKKLIHHSIIISRRIKLEVEEINEAFKAMNEGRTQGRIIAILK